MTREEAINQLKDFIILHREQHGWDVSTLNALDMAIKALEKQKAISELRPPTDDWENYADRLYDLAYLRGYADGLIAKKGKNTDGDNKRN